MGRGGKVGMHVWGEVGEKKPEPCGRGSYQELLSGSGPQGQGSQLPVLPWPFSGQTGRGVASSGRPALRSVGRRNMYCSSFWSKAAKP